MTYIPPFVLPVLGADDLSINNISDITTVVASDISISDLTKLSVKLSGITISGLSSYQTVWSGVTRNILWVP